MSVLNADANKFGVAVLHLIDRIIQGAEKALESAAALRNIAVWYMGSIKTVGIYL